MSLITLVNPKHVRPIAPYAEVRVKACLTGLCTRCGQPIRADNEDESVIHFDTVDEFLDALKPHVDIDEDPTFVGGGGWLAGTFVPSNGPNPRNPDPRILATWGDYGWNRWWGIRHARAAARRLLGRPAPHAHDDVMCMACATLHACTQGGHLHNGAWLPVACGPAIGALTGVEMQHCARRWCVAPAAESRAYRFDPRHPMAGCVPDGEAEATGTVVYVDDRPGPTSSVAVVDADGMHVLVQVRAQDTEAFRPLLTVGATVTVAGWASLTTEPSIVAEYIALPNPPLA